MPLASLDQPALPQWLYPANLLTELRLLTIPLIMVALGLHRNGWALGLFIVAAVSDGFDGYLARNFNQHSTLGGYLDPIADKLLLVTLFLMLAIEGELPWALSLLVLVRDACILTSVLALFAFTDFRDFRPTMWGKASTTAELATVSVALLANVTSAGWVMVLERVGWVSVTFLALVSGVHYAFAAAARYHARRAA